MGKLLQDRFSAILHFIEKWQENDPKLERKEEFLSFIKTCDLGYFNVGDTRVWMNYYKKAKKNKISIAELLFERKKKILNTKKREDKNPLKTRYM